MRANWRRSKLGLVANQAASCPAGSAIIWRAISNGHDQYRFWLRGPGTGHAWQDMTSWTPDAQWTWWTTSSDAGTNVIGVEGRISSRSTRRPDQTSIYYTVGEAKRRDYYQVLGIAGDADSEEIRTAYRSLAMRHHPDKCPDVKKRWCMERFLEIREAYETLIDADRRLLYDRARATATWPHPQQKGAPIITGLEPTPPDQQHCGSSVVWTARAADHTDAPIHYRFRLKGPATGNAWQDMTGWTDSNVWAWHPAPGDVGSNSVKVEVRHAGTGSPGDCEDWDIRDYKINKEITSLRSAIEQKALLAMIAIMILGSVYGSMYVIAPHQTIRLTSNASDELIAGSTVLWTASASEDEGDELFYRFLLQGPSSGNAWQSVTRWSSNNSWIWCPSQEDIGENRIRVQIRHGGEEEGEKFDAERAESAIVRSQPAMSDLHSCSVDPKESDSNVTGSSDANDPAGELFYSFLLRDSSGDEIWKVKQDWSMSDAETHVASAADKGEDGTEQPPGGDDARDTRDYDVEMISSYILAAPEDEPAAYAAQSFPLMMGRSSWKKIASSSTAPIGLMQQQATFPSSCPTFSTPPQEVFGRQIDRPASFTPCGIATAIDRERQNH